MYSIIILLVVCCLVKKIFAMVHFLGPREHIIKGIFNILLSTFIVYFIYM